MRWRKIFFFITLFVAIDQIVKFIINNKFLAVNIELIPNVFEFKPIYNNKYSYINYLSVSVFDVDLGFFFHIFIFSVGLIFMFILYDYFRIIIPGSIILDVTFILGISGVICAIIGSLFWEKGCLDFFYLKPLFVFDFKDIYLTAFFILYLIFISKNKMSLKKYSTSHFVDHFLRRIHLK